jgi:hypothetical protein
MQECSLPKLINFTILGSVRTPQEAGFLSHFQGLSLRDLGIRQKHLLGPLIYYRTIEIDLGKVVPSIASCLLGQQVTAFFMI